MSKNSKKNDSPKESPKREKSVAKVRDRKMTFTTDQFDFSKVEVLGPESKKGKDSKGAALTYYEQQITYHMDDKNDCYVQVKFKNIQNIYWSKFDEEVKDDEGKVKKVSKYSCSIYKNKESNRELVDFCKKLSPILLQSIENYKGEMGPKMKRLKFDPKLPKDQISDKWGGLFKMSNSGKKLLKARPTLATAKPDIQRTVKNAKTGKNERIPVNPETLIGTNIKTTCDIVLRFNHIYLAETVVPQIRVISALLKNVERGGDVDEKLWDNETQEVDESTIDNLDSKLRGLGVETPTPAAPPKAKIENVKDKVDKFKENLKKKESDEDSEEEVEEDSASS